MRRRAVCACAVIALAAPLGGCVAAAIPVLAAGGIAAKELDRDPKRTLPSEAVVQPLPEVTLEAEIAPIPPAPIPPAAVAATASASAAGTVVSASAPASPPAAASSAYAEFVRHAAAQAALDPVTAPRKSALLATPGALRPITQDCGILPPAVIIDLDPAGGKLDPATALPVNPVLSDGLARLRSADVTVFWVSGATAVEAGRVRDHLLAAGLDPWGRDPLLLMRRSDDRKELRRREVAGTHCVVAIAGDSKSDFDELFEFLRNPAAATALDELLGKGWFLAPSLAPSPAPGPAPAPAPAPPAAATKDL